MFCSTIIPTIGRPSLARAVESVLTQNFLVEEYEVIVVNDSGQPLLPADWQASECVQVIDTVKRERSAARNCGAAAAKGRYLHFLDDDDWLDPDAYQNLWQLSQRSSAVWLYGISQLLDRQMRTLIRLHHKLNGNCSIQTMAGEWIPLQSSIIDARTFFKVGGFNPLITGPEDIDLLRRISLTGEIAETPHLVANIVRGEEGSTTDYDNHANASRWAREKILETSGVFHVLRKSARGSFWRSRMVRIYLTSCVWNIRNKRYFTASTRALHAAAGIAGSGLGFLTPGFWSSLARPYASPTFNRETG